MADEQLAISLLTPASDLVVAGGTNAPEALFGRAGNDTIYPDNPVASATQATNVDYLFGDLFDNSAEEFEIILNIQNAQQGGNPFLILNRNIPSVGADRFVLGDTNQPYYTTSNPDTLLTTNFLGLNEFAVIYDFGVNNDVIQLNGKPKDYRIVKINGLQVQGVAQPISGQAIFSLQQGAPDLVTFVVAKPEVNLDLKSNNFRFVGEKPPKKPARNNKIQQLGTTGLDLSLAASKDSAGNIYISGSTTGPLFGTNQGFTDAWIAKYDSNGNQVWGRQFGSSGDESNFAMVADKDGNTYLAGGTSGNLFGTKQTEADVWVAKYDTNGNQVWGRQFTAGGFSSGAFSIDLDPAGNVYLSGIAIKNNTRTDIFNFAVQDDSWVSKFDTNGNQQWITPIKDPSATFPFDITPFFDESYDLAVDKDGNSIAVGWTQGLVRESDPSRQLLKYDVWVSKVNTAGQVQWVQQLGSTNQGLDFAWGVDTDSQGNIYVTGWTTGDIGTQVGTRGIGDRDIWISKLRPDGSQVWAKQFGSPDDDGMFLSDVEIDQQDNIFLIGHSNGKLGKGQKDESYNTWVARFDTDGNNKWIQQFGSRKNLDYPTGVTTDSAGKLYVTGFTDGLLGKTNGVNTSAVDGWLAELNIKNGKLQKFIGSSNDFVSIDEPGLIPTVDITNNLVTRERLPLGDNRINPAEGINLNFTQGIGANSAQRVSTSGSAFNYGQIVSGLGSIFDPESENSFPSALAEAVNNGTIVV
ncbi:SBBP repeat-containing protein [Nostoc sp. CHAB 5836]|uniref:SBBP repeat-containing protein n=1 Tax=Nostoc sp. CHAB 5836 TaxID=2780404 RepID=UPI001E2E9747|nr:SBBP repeat-containing protein [Nostoc sp. CHAB 5836]MCC5615246.1 SBBP repeat-containing protein [Nostoc sp. CHAB 5836]